MRYGGLLTLTQRVQLRVAAVELQEVVDHLGSSEHRGLSGIVRDHLMRGRCRRTRWLRLTSSAERTERIRGRPRGVPS